MFDDPHVVEILDLSALFGLVMHRLVVEGGRSCHRQQLGQQVFGLKGGDRKDVDTGMRSSQRM